MNKQTTVKKLTDYKWLNLFKLNSVNAKGKAVDWIFASRKNDPFKNNDPDAVVIVATVDTIEGKKIVITKEYRAPINDYEYGFPAGLIDTDKTIEYTVENELKEETGLNLKKIIGKSNIVVSSAGLPIMEILRRAAS